MKAGSEHLSNIDALELLRLLKDKGINNFHHANTVKTSLSFIIESALLSRHYIEREGLIQTEQYTDQKDKILRLWDSVFLDGLDLHTKFWRRNKYGPILFHINLDVLKHPDFSKIRVTKSNPDSWRPNENHFYNSIEDIDKDYRTGNKLIDGRIMFLFDKPEKKISLFEYCKKIVIDDPFVYLPVASVTSIGELVKITITQALKKSGMEKTEVVLRHADRKTCACMSQYRGLYKSHKDIFNKLFSKE